MKKVEYTIEELIEICKGQEMSDDVLYFILEQQNSTILEKLVNNKHMEYTDHQIRMLIEKLPFENVQKIKEHKDYLEFVDSNYCLSLEDFKKHTEHHIKNVVDISLDILEYVQSKPHLKEYFKIKDYSSQFIDNFIYHGLILHDKAKLCEEEDFLRKNNLEEPLYKILYSHYGKGISPELKDIIHKLNTIDNQIIEEYLNNQKVNQDLKDFFMKMEKLADCIERGCNVVTSEEMKKAPMKPSEFLKDSISKEEMEIVQYMEKKYHLGYVPFFESKDMD